MKFPLRINLLLWTGVPLALLFALVMSVRSCVTQFAANACEPITEISYRSPGGSSEAVLNNRYCAPGFGVSSDQYWIVVRDIRHSDDGAKIFFAWDYAPDIAWIDENQIVITIQNVSDIQTSLHEAGSIKIKYRVADRLLRDNFMRELKENTKRLSARAVDFELKNYENFHKWATANTENGGL